MASAATLACALLYREIGWLGAAVATGLFLVSPPAQLVVSGIMAEPVTAALCLGAAAAYIGYLERPRPAPALAFGALAGLALLTKGVAISLAFLPAAALLHGRKQLWKRWDFWAPAAVVLALAGPWYLGLEYLPGLGDGLLYTFEETIRKRSLGWRAEWEILAKGPAALRALGWGTGGLALLGFAVRVVKPARAGSLSARAAVLGTYFAAFMIGHVALRFSNEPRHLLQVVPIAMGFAFAGALWGIERIAARRSPAWRAAAAALVCLLAAGGVERFAPPARGLDRAAQAIRADSQLDEAVILVSSRAGGEVIFVAEMAALEPRPGRIVLRGTKVLAEAGWNPTRYELRYRTAAEVADYLDSIPVGVVVLENLAGSSLLRHHDLLREALALDPDGWRRLDPGAGPVEVYRSTRPDLRRKAAVRIDLTRRIGRVLKLPLESPEEPR